MGLIVSSTAAKKIHVKGTPIELETSYLRVAFSSRVDGKTMEIAFDSFYDKAGFQAGNFLNTDLPEGSITIEIAPNETQGVESALSYMALALTQHGYGVEVETMTALESI